MTSTLIYVENKANISGIQMTAKLHLKWSQIFHLITHFFVFVVVTRHPQQIPIWPSFKGFFLFSKVKFWFYNPFLGMGITIFLSKSWAKSSVRTRLLIGIMAKMHWLYLMVHMLYSIPWAAYRMLSVYVFDALTFGYEWISNFMAVLLEKNWHIFVIF